MPFASHQSLCHSHLWALATQLPRAETVSSASLRPRLETFPDLVHGQQEGRTPLIPTQGLLALPTSPALAYMTATANVCSLIHPHCTHRHRPRLGVLRSPFKVLTVVFPKLTRWMLDLQLVLKTLFKQCILEGRMEKAWKENLLPSWEEAKFHR